ncbi:hypothetical protein PR048_023561 [Dryococelus australis]|uniref:Integrase zinc-binding domain-containing protein n=1 Tax=Dryococelus australis TaxID=614101 RepID=A0ABQ9GUH9_9NEOP|nr:hypothetical protein PR048_023561 [Dryococelus australis]
MYKDAEGAVERKEMPVVEREELEDGSEECCIMIRTMPEMFTDFRDWQRDDKECDEIKDMIAMGKTSRYHLDEEMIYFVDKYNNKKFFVPKKARGLVLKYFHCSTMGAHVGRDKTKALIKI